MMIKGFKYWIMNWLEVIGMSAGIALVIMVLKLGGSMDLSGDIKNMIFTEISNYPFYLFAVSLFVIMMLAMGYFKVYLPVLVSMNVTRKTVVYGIMGVVAASIASVILLTMVIWKLMPGSVANIGNELLVLFAGLLFLVAAVSLLLGFILVRWGRVGAFIMAGAGMLLGGFMGFTVASGMWNDLAGIVIKLIMKFDLWWTLVLGLVVYLLAGVFILAATRNVEVRV